MKSKGYVLMETIVVIFVLCVILVLLYSSYSNIMIKLNTASLYDNTEYIYKTSVVRDYLNSLNNLDTSTMTFCQNSVATNKCYEDNTGDDYQYKLFQFLQVEAIYIMPWDISDIAANASASQFNFDATTQRYLKYLDVEVNDENRNWKRIVVMFKQENDNNESIKKYEYATLRLDE